MDSFRWKTEEIPVFNLFVSPRGKAAPAMVLSRPRVTSPREAAASGKPVVHLQGSHELYNSGHLFEAAVAHFQATGKTSFLDVATKNADLLLEVFGPDKRLDSPGHQVIEIGLPKLYRATGNRAYLELAKFFLDQRGKEHAYQDYPEGPFAMYNGMEYRQAHLPVLEQTEASRVPRPGRVPARSHGGYRGPGRGRVERRASGSPDPGSLRPLGQPGSR